MSYSICFTSRAVMDLDDLTAEMHRRVLAKLSALEQDPRPPGAVALKSEAPSCYRLRVQDLRIGYEVDDACRTVTVWQIGDRKRFYERAGRRR